MFVFSYVTDGNISKELFYRGLVSLLLTFINIICIVVVGVVVLFLKRVRSPHFALTEPKEHHSRSLQTEFFRKMPHSEKTTWSTTELMRKP